MRGLYRLGAILFLAGITWTAAAGAEQEPAKDSTTATAATTTTTTTTTAKPADTAKPVESKEDYLGAKNGWVRLELTTMTGYHSGHHKRGGDYQIRGNAEYEMPVLEHMTVGTRVATLYYNENEDGDAAIWAFGIGVVLRGYLNGKEERGLYAELGAHLFGQTAKFEGNSGGFNFMEEFGIGYEFKKGWHVAAKVGHFSNAGLADNNDGVNNAGIGFGYRFKP